MSGRNGVHFSDPGGAIRAALSVLIGLEPDRIMPVAPGSLAVLEPSGSAWLKSFNNTPKVAARDALA